MRRQLSTRTSPPKTSPAKTSPAKTSPAKTAEVFAQSPLPLYHRIYVLLRDQITSGAYGAGELLPTEHEISADFGVSRVTAKRALDHLAEEGLVERRRGRGTTVLLEVPPRPLSAPLTGLLQNLELLADSTLVQALESGFVVAPQRVAEALGLTVGATVFRLLRCRRQNADSFALLTSHTTPKAAEVLVGRDLDQLSRTKAFMAAGFGIGKAEQTLSATLAEGRAAAILGVAPGSALLKLDRLLFDVSGRPFDHLTALYRPDMFQYRMDLRLEGGKLRP